MFLSQKKEKEEDLDFNLEDSREQVPMDRYQQEVLGEKAVSNYYKHYKSLDKVRQQNATFGVEDSTFTVMLAKLEK